MDSRPVGSSASSNAEEARSVLQTPPTLQVINNRELVGLIVDSFAGITGRNEVLLLLTTVNRSFFHASTDLLWQSMPSLLPFLQLLPACQAKTGQLPESVIDVLQGDPWSRFRVYQHKTQSLRLAEGAHGLQQMPSQWFSCLFHHPSRPSSLFPAIKTVDVECFDDLNSVFFFHLLPFLQCVTVSKCWDKTGWQKGNTENSLELLMTNLACHAPRLRTLSFGALPFTDTIKLSISKMKNLSKIVFCIQCPASPSDLAFLLSLPQLQVVGLSGFRSEREGDLPEAGTHLARKQNQPTAIVETLILLGDGYTAFWAASLLSSPSLRHFDMKFAEGVHQDVLPESFLLIPLMLHIMTHHSQNIEEFSVDCERIGPGPVFDVFDDDDPRKRIPSDFFDSLSSLQHLTVLSLENIPFVCRDFAARLVQQLPNLPRLQKFCLIPRSLSTSPEHRQLILPKLFDLRTIAFGCRSLVSLGISVDFSTLTADTEVAGIPFSKSSVRTLYLLPNEPTSLDSDMPTIVKLATYLDHLFPHLEDLASDFPRTGMYTSEEYAAVRALWGKVECLVKSNQALRLRLSRGVAATVSELIVPN